MIKRSSTHLKSIISKLLRTSILIKKKMNKTLKGHFEGILWGREIMNFSGLSLVLIYNVSKNCANLSISDIRKNHKCYKKMGPLKTGGIGSRVYISQWYAPGTKLNPPGHTPYTYPQGFLVRGHAGT